MHCISAILLLTYVFVISAISLNPAKLFRRQGPEITPLPKFDDDAVFILFPGAGGPDGNTDRLIDTIRESDKKLGEKRFSLCYDWQEWRGNILRAAYDGQHVGRTIGKQLAMLDRPLRSIHIVGISVGAFAANECVEEFHKIRQEISPLTAGETTSRLTLLDPFTSRGLFGPKYGSKYFGLASHYCEQFMNTDDPVPSTNDPLPNAHVFDITASKEREAFIPLEGDSMHSWPVAYYGMNWAGKIDDRVKTNGDFIPSHTKRPRGVVTRIP